MEIKIVNRISFSELESSVRAVPLKGLNPDGSQRLVYTDARISLKRFYTEEINPTTFYLLKRGIKLQRELRTTLLDKYEIDTLNLDAAYEIENEKGEIWGLTPPIIELTPRKVKYVPRKGEIPYEDEVVVQVPIINDGAHRVWLARENHETFVGLFISGADPNFPFYAHPNEWSMVKILDEVPKDKRDKKFYSMENCYDLYRDFEVLGCGAPRSE